MSHDTVRHSGNVLSITIFMGSVVITSELDPPPPKYVKTTPHMDTVQLILLQGLKERTLALALNRNYLDLVAKMC